MYRTLSAPILVQWEVTPTCNHKCLHCYNFWRTKPPKQSLPDGYNELYAKIVDEIIKNKIFSVVITGGEPLVVIEKISPFIQHLAESGISVSLNSNLSLLTPRKTDLLKECGIRSILVSLPTANPDTCSFLTNKANALPSIIAGIKLAIAQGFRVVGNMVVSKYNLPEIEQTVELAHTLHMHDFAVTRASNPAPNSWFAEKILDKKDFLQMQERIDCLKEKFSFDLCSLEAVSLCAYGEAHVGKATRSCNAGKTSCMIDIDGFIHPCIRLEKGYGHISKGLVSAWLAMNEYRSGELIPITCKQCKLKNRCEGGCKADALVSTGSIVNPDPLYNLSNIPSIKPTDVPQVTAEKFSVNSKIRTRNESFGEIVYVSSTQWIPIDSQLLPLMIPRSTITILDLCLALSISESDARDTASFLVHNKFLIPIESQLP
ncbi:MAG: radical SAM protein [Patescibacteria group bacterium]|nr:radical SAM protein [Patescibacteria group bacterium]